MRIALIHISQETNDFHPVLTTLADYAAFGIHEGPAILEKARGHAAIDGWIDAIRVDTTGPGKPDVTSLPWKRTPRPFFPLDEIAQR